MFLSSYVLKSSYLLLIYCLYYLQYISFNISGSFFIKQRLLTILWRSLIYYSWNYNRLLIYSSYSSLSSQWYFSVLYRGLFLTAYFSHFLTFRQPFLACQFLIYLLNLIQSSFKSFFVYLNLLFSFTGELFYLSFILVFFNFLRISTVVFIFINVYPNNSNTFFPIHLLK